MEIDYEIVTLLLGIGATAWIISYVSRSLFFDRSNQHNPFRSVMVGLGYVGIAFIISALVILVAQIT